MLAADTHYGPEALARRHWMEIKHGMISCDSSAQLDKDAFTSRMSKAKWEDRIPRVVEIEDPKSGEFVHKCRVDGKLSFGGVVNRPAVMHDWCYYPRRWEEVPMKAYDPQERLEALDEDGVDAEVLFPNTPIQNFSFAASVRLPAHYVDLSESKEAAARMTAGVPEDEKKKMVYQNAMRPYSLS
jgi:hypothetical protein